MRGQRNTGKMAEAAVNCRAHLRSRPRGSRHRGAQNEMITAFSTKEPVDHAGLYETFLAREGDTSGTVVLHHGRVKRPGKQVPGFSRVELSAVTADVDKRLLELAREAEERFGLNQVLVAHRIGTIGAGDTVLLVIVSCRSRGPAFSACAWIVDQIKKEEIIALAELT